jgi:hypothetical protein
MQNLYTTAFDIDTADGTDVLAVARDVATWATRADAGTLDLTSSGTTAHKETGRIATWTPLGDDLADPQAMLVELRLPDSRNVDIMWKSNVDIANHGDRIRVTVRVHRGTSEIRIAPTSLQELKAPVIVRDLLAAFTCSVGGLRLAAESQFLLNDDVDAFIDGIIRNPARRLPVVVVTRAPGQSGLREYADGVAVRLAGLAHVAALSGALAYDRAYLRLGFSQHVPRGGARIYWPIDGTRELRNPYWTRSALAENSMAFDDIAFGMISRVAVHGVPDDSVIAELRRPLRSEPTDGLVPLDDYTALWELWEEKAQRVTELEAELEQAHGLLATAYSNAAAMASTSQDSPVGLPDEPQAPGDWDEFADRLPMLANDGIVFTDRCLDGVRNCKYLHVERMWNAVADLAEAGAELHRKNGAVGERLRDWFKEQFNLDYAHHDEALRRNGLDIFEFEGTSLNRCEHIKVDDVTKLNECGRIYFAKDGSRLVVDHIGLHL